MAPRALHDALLSPSQRQSAEIFSLYVDAGVTGGDPPAPEDFKPVWEAWNARSPEDQAALSVAANEALVARIETLNAEQRTGFHVTMFGRMPVDLAGVLGLRPARLLFALFCHSRSSLCASGD